MSFDLTNKNIQDTFQNLLQRTGSDNRLYDLTGNEIGDLRISGSLIAQQYVVSSSVTNITTQQLSGSTQFGDSLDDTHQFTGSLNVTGSITKGNIPFVLSNQTGSFVTNIDSPSQGNIRKTDAVTGVGSNISLGLRTTDNVKFNHITASGNISASGKIITSELSALDDLIIDVDGADILLKDDGTSFGRFKRDSSDFVIKAESNNNDIIFKGQDGGATITALTLDMSEAGAATFNSHITASGNISASGDILTSGDFLNSQTIQMTNSSSVINTFNTGSHQTCKYVLQVTSGSFIQSSEMLVVQSGSNAFNTEYAQIGTAVNLGSFSTSVSGNVVKLSFAGDFISCSVKFNRTLI